MNKRQKNIGIILFEIILFALLILALSQVDYGYSRFNKVTQLDGWTVTEKKIQTLQMTQMVDEKILGKSIMFYTSDSYVKVKIDDDVIYTYGKKTSICQSPGSLWQFVEIPADSGLLGKKITIDIKTVYPEKFTTNIVTYVGSSGALIVDKVFKELPNTVVNIILFVYGIVLMIIYRIERMSDVEKKTDYYLAILCVITFFWSNCELFSFQLFFPSGVGQYFLYYICFMLLPLYLIRYVEALTKVKVKKVIVFHLVFSACLILLQLLRICEFTQSLVLFLPVVMIEMFGAGIYQVRKSQTEWSKTNYIALGIFLVSIAVNSLMYLMDSTSHTSMLVVKLGLIVYVMVNTYLSFLYLVRSMVEISNNEKIKAIAYMDQLTQIGNRYAFVRDIETVELPLVGLISFDLNNLKYYNDTLGHIKGDQMIKDAADLLCEVYEDKIYRTGGDEFLGIAIGKTMEELNAARDSLREECEHYNRRLNNDIVMEIACGFSVFQAEDKTYEDILNRADQAMYENKKELKEKSSIKSMR